ncbi:hypothetical protein Bpfe_029536 [Biomphalaria pfeifferi]|uniref:Uncharacterized protein n=1 Tax=Biomphalaria pfeifferi TaxID=112525 RepID=A0AAD8ASH3_BIOPF|nr:hypothetical protein Bpfe_029536 [Biomphalaria pfeifferi]
MVRWALRIKNLVARTIASMKAKLLEDTQCSSLGLVSHYATEHSHVKPTTATIQTPRNEGVSFIIILFVSG